MQSDFTKVNEKNLIPSLDCRLPVKDGLHNGFSSSVNCISELSTNTALVPETSVAPRVTFTRRPLFLLEEITFAHV